MPVYGNCNVFALSMSLGQTAAVIHVFIMGCPVLSIEITASVGLDALKYLQCMNTDFCFIILLQIELLQKLT